MWDMSILQVVPGLRIAAPRDAAQLRALLREAVEVDDAPTVLRFPKGSVGPGRSRRSTGSDGMDVLRRGRAAARPAGDVLIVAVGALAAAALDAAGAAGRGQGHRRDRGRPALGQAGQPGRWSSSPATTALVVTVEDNGRVGGVGAAIGQALQDADVFRPTKVLGVPAEFQAHDERPAILARLGLDGSGIAAAARGLLKN